jgi:hypothetical protein
LEHPECRECPEYFFEGEEGDEEGDEGEGIKGDK